MPDREQALRTVVAQPNLPTLLLFVKTSCTSGRRQRSHASRARVGDPRHTAH
jgi:hypothetical protein